VARTALDADPGLNEDSGAKRARLSGTTYDDRTAFPREFSASSPSRRTLRT
jgi:hypothetical protein